MYKKTVEPILENIASYGSKTILNWTLDKTPVDAAEVHCF